MANPLQERFNWAVLVDKFGGDIARLATLTDAQVYGVLGHPRDKDGVLVPPKRPKPMGEALKLAKLFEIAKLKWARVITLEKAQEMARKVEAEFDDKRGG